MTEDEETRITKEDEDGSAGYFYFDVFLRLPKFLLLFGFDSCRDTFQGQILHCAVKLKIVT